MGKFERFEDIKAWQMARELVKGIYVISRETNIAKDFGFRDQIRKSAVSTMANIAEGFERYSNKEFTQFLIIARGSAGELRSHLYVAFDIGYIEQDVFEKLKTESIAISKCIYNLIKYLKESH